MGNTEQSVTVKVCPEDGRPVNQWLSCDEHHRWAVDAEFAPAEQLRGAVGAIEQAFAALSDRDLTPEAARARAGVILQDFLNASGGQ